jgi:hypothetical protein
MVQGETVHDETVLNIEDLWSGGPFQSAVSCIILHFLYCLTTTITSSINMLNFSPSAVEILPPPTQDL